MKMRYTIGLLAAIALLAGGPAFAGHRKHRHADEAQAPQFVPAGKDWVEWLFGGPRYYDHRLFTTGGEPCAYNRVGPDANAVNDINDHYCGK